ncbi:MAG TPA: SURF1 family protein [Nocardioidaceae bacterium]|nr:SURF1 family protein [Actinomycetota bacterium]HEV8055215.1 SURF1 family protein [Nocardioidaceae bacterium]
MFRFLLSRRWILFGIFVAVLGVACWRLGIWQFHRLEERRADNAIIEANLTALPLPASAVLHTDQPLPEEAQWRRVVLQGRYAAEDEVLVRYQTRDGRPGATVVTPLVLDTGPAVLVDRGWLPVTNNPSADVIAPDPPPGRVTVTGWARPDQSGETEQITPDDGQVRLISSAGLAGTVDVPLVHGFVSADVTAPSAAGDATSLVTTEPPELDSGPHFFYGVQWWFFAALAVGGFGYFAWVEARERRDAG